MGAPDIGLERLARLHATVWRVQGRAPIVIDSDDIVARPDAAMAACCRSIGLPDIRVVKVSPRLYRDVIRTQHSPGCWSRLANRRLSSTPC